MMVLDAVSGAREKRRGKERVGGGCGILVMRSLPAHLSFRGLG